MKILSSFSKRFAADLLIAALLSVLILSYSPLTLAQSIDEYSAVVTSGNLMGMFMGFGVMMMFWSLIGLLAFIFWIWMLIDCLKRNFEDKIIWVIVIILLNIVGAILYYFMVKKNHQPSTGTSQTTQPSEPKTPSDSV